MKWILYAVCLLPVLGYSQDGQGVVINEFLASSDSLSGIADPSGSYADWIELYNNNTSLVNLAGFFLSDNFAIPDKFIFPVGAQIEADGYVIIWADKDLNEEGLHADFKLDKEGEQIVLLNASAEVLDTITYGPQETNVSFARIPNGTGPFTQRAPTFSANNDDGVSSIGRIVQENLRIFPNPATTHLTVSWPVDASLQPEQWQVVDAQGRTYELAAQNTGSEEFTLTLDELTPGIYFLWIRSGARYFVRELVIVR